MENYGGHAFVIDGYDSGRYHVNWGWDGQSNGFFMLTGLNVTGASYNDYQDAVIGIQSPEGTAGTVKPKAQVYSVVYNDEKKYFWRRDDGTFPKFNMFANVYSTTGEKEKLQLGWGLFNEKGLVTVYAQEQQEIGSDESECYGYFASIVIDDKIDDGDYCLLPVCRGSDSEEWSADVANLYGSGLRPDYYTEIRISNNLMKLIYDGTSKSFERDNHGYLIKDGIAFDLWQDLDEKHYATVITPQSGHYSGDIVIPDVISHNSKDYKVYDADLTTFENCQELTSLSISMIQGPRIWNCPKLKTIEFREGTTDYPDKNRIFLCDKLKTIKFNTINQLLFQGCPFEDYLPALTDVYFMSIYPPSQPPFYGEDNFSVKENVTLHIPKGAMPDYQKSGWKSWNLSDDLVVENKAVKWGYVNDNNTGHYNSPEIGSLERCDVDLAIHVPAEMIGKYKDQKIISKLKLIPSRIKKQFIKSFYLPKEKYLYDVVGNNKLRPNQLFALSLTNPVIDPTSEICENIIDIVDKKLLLSHGLKTLARGDEDYIAEYEGGPLQRDMAYHQGPAWPWLLGLYFDALNNMIKFEKDKSKKKKLEDKRKRFIDDTYITYKKEIYNSEGVCTISELYNSKLPYKPGGTISQAWSVSEVLRIIMCH